MYADEGISAKNDRRPAYQEMMRDVKDKKINVIVAFKLDRLTRSVYDIEKLMKFVNDNDCDIDCMADESNTTTSNGRMVMGIMTSVSQNEINQIEFNKNELNKKWQEQKQYENLSFTVDDLLILQDIQQIDDFVKPELFFININKWLNTPREKKQKLFAKYIDFIELEKNDKEIDITNGHFRESFLVDMINNHAMYGTPREQEINDYIYEQNYGYDKDYDDKDIDI